MKITKSDVYLFTCGDCNIFAMELERVTGWPVFMTDCHVFNVVDGHPVDVEGVHEMRDFEERWGEYKEGPYDAEVAAKSWTWKGDNGSRRRAVEIAPLVAEQIRKELDL